MPTAEQMRTPLPPGEGLGVRALFVGLRNHQNR